MNLTERIYICLSLSTSLGNSMCWTKVNPENPKGCASPKKPCDCHPPTPAPPPTPHHPPTTPHGAAGSACRGNCSVLTLEISLNLGFLEGGPESNSSNCPWRQTWPMYQQVLRENSSSNILAPQSVISWCSLRSGVGSPCRNSNGRIWPMGNLTS